jgi:hypothetical protein
MIARPRSEGRTRSDLGRALSSLTGQDFRGNTQLWQRWWKDNEASFQVAPEDASKTSLQAAVDAVGVSFFGITTESQRVLFVIDCSLSMNFSMTPKNNPTDEPGRGFDTPDESKGEISRLTAAKRALRRPWRIRDGGEFNIICYAADVWAGDDAGVWYHRRARKRSTTSARSKAPPGPISTGAGENLTCRRQCRQLVEQPAFDTIFLSDGRATIGLSTDTEQILSLSASATRLPESCCTRSVWRPGRRTAATPGRGERRAVRGALMRDKSRSRTMLAVPCPSPSRWRLTWSCASPRPTARRARTFAQRRGPAPLHVLELAAYGEPRGGITLVHDAGEHGALPSERAPPGAEPLGGRPAGPARAWPLRRPARSQRRPARGAARPAGDPGPPGPLARRRSQVLIGQGLGRSTRCTSRSRSPRSWPRWCCSLHAGDQTELPKPAGGLLKLFRSAPTDAGRIGNQPALLTSSNAERHAWEGDGLVHDVITLRAAQEAHALAADGRARRFARRADALLHGSADLISDPADSRAPGPRVSLHIEEGWPTTCRTNAAVSAWSRTFAVGWS